METPITAQDIQLINKLKEVIPKLSPSNKNKILTVAETMTILHDARKLNSAAGVVEN